LLGRSDQRDVDTVRVEGSPSKFSARVERLAAGLHVLLASPSPAAAEPSRLRQAQRRLTSEQVGQLVEEYRAGDSMKALAARWALHRSTVAGHLRHAGVQLRRQGLSEEQLREGVRLYRGLVTPAAGRALLV